VPKHFFLSFLPWLALLFLWELAGQSGALSAFVLPWPSLVLTAAWSHAATGALFFDIAWSLVRVFGGFFLAVLLATPLGLLIGLSERASSIFEPAVHFLRPIPPVAWIPLAIVWFGLGNGPAFFLTFIAAFFPVIVSTAHGVRSIPAQHFQVARCLEASRSLVFRRIVIPGALPHILAGFRIGFGISWMAVVTAEMIAARSGLGHLIHVSQDVLHTDLVVAGMLCIGLLGLLFDILLRGLARRLTPWGPA